MFPLPLHVASVSLQAAETEGQFSSSKTTSLTSARSNIINVTMDTVCANAITCQQQLERMLPAHSGPR